MDSLALIFNTIGQDLSEKQFFILFIVSIFQIWMPFYGRFLFPIKFKFNRFSHVKLNTLFSTSLREQRLFQGSGRAFDSLPTERGTLYQSDPFFYKGMTLFAPERFVAHINWISTNYIRQFRCSTRSRTRIVKVYYIILYPIACKCFF